VFPSRMNENAHAGTLALPRLVGTVTEPSDTLVMVTVRQTAPGPVQPDWSSLGKDRSAAAGGISGARSGRATRLPAAPGW
jgi:hypothetical protein